MDRDVDGLVRDTFHSSLQLASMALTILGIDDAAAERAVALFRDHDEKNLVETHAIYRDEKQLIQKPAAGDRRTGQPVRGGSGVVSGIASHSTSVATAPTRASATNAIRMPAVSAIQPPSVVLSPAPRLHRPSPARPCTD